MPTPNLATCLDPLVHLRAGAPRWKIKFCVTNRKFTAWSPTNNKGKRIKIKCRGWRRLAAAIHAYSTGKLRTRKK
jgi:hypothetical protein